MAKLTKLGSGIDDCEVITILTRGLKALDILREADAPLRLTHIAEFTGC